MQTLNFLTSKQTFKLIAVSAFGSCFELCDYMLFAFLSVVLAQVFFPQTNPNAALLSVFLIYFLSYFSRFLGGFFFSHFGDKHGRKNTFMTSLILMAIPSFLIGVLPSYAQVGMLSPWILIFLRFLQGFALGGEVSGAVTFLSEHVSSKFRALACASLSFAANMGVVLAALSVHFMLSHLTAQQMLQWGWRLPFLIGGLLSFIGFYIRKNFFESDSFLALQREHKLENFPVFYALRHQGKNILLLSTLVIAVGMSTATFHIYFPTYLVKYKHFQEGQAFFLVTIGIVCMASASLLFAYLSDVVGRKYFYRFSILSTAIVSLLGPFVFMQNFKGVCFFIVLVSLCLAPLNGTYLVVSVEMFETKIRYTCTSCAYSFGVLVGAGMAPFINTYLIEKTHNQNIPFMLVSVTLIVLFFVTRQIHETKGNGILVNIQ